MNLLPPPRTVLVVENDARLRNGLGELLRQSGYEVVAASNVRSPSSFSAAGAPPI